MAKKSVSHSWGKRLLLAVMPHPDNNHHPHAIRHSALALYIAAVLTFNVGYNVVVAHSTKVLGFATAISQQEVIRLTNVERAKAGVGALTENGALDRSAMDKAKNMFEEDYWAHYAPSGKSPWFWFDKEGYSYSLAGENLARDFDTSQGVINGWMNSPSHKQNMLAPGYKDIGIAVLNGVLGGKETTLVVQHFGTPLTPVAGSSSQGSSGSTPAVKGSTGQTTLKQTPLPTQMVTEQTIEQEEDIPVANGTGGVPTSNQNTWATLSYQLLNPLPANGWGMQQMIVIALMAGLMVLFIFDFAVLHRKGIHRPNSHSLLHAGMMAACIVVVIYSTAGGIL